MEKSLLEYVDEDYFKKGTEWFKKETAQISLFDWGKLWKRTK